MRRYLHAVRACLRHPWRTCIASAVFFGFSLWLASLLPSTFMDVGDEALSIVTIEAPPGSTLKDTLALNEGAYERLRDMPEIVHIYSLIVNGVTAGSTVSSGGSVTTATLLIPLTPQNERDRPHKQTQDENRKT